MSFLESILSYIKLPARFLFGLTCVGLIVLFAPDSFLNSLRILPLRDDYGSYIGVGTLICFVFFFIQLIPHMLRRFAKNKLRFERLKLLSSLSKEEKGLLAYCLDNNQQTIITAIDDPTARSLSHKGILIMGAGTNHMLKWPFTVESYTWDYLRHTSNSCLDGYFPYSPTYNPHNRLFHY